MSLLNFAKRVYYLTRKKVMVPIVVPKDLNNDMEGKTALIVGGTGGIGLEIARLFHESGSNVIISGSKEKVEQELVKFHSEHFKGLPVDITQINDLTDYIDKAWDLFGDIDILVNAAGVHTERLDIDFLNFTEDEYDFVMATNLKGSYFLCQNFANKVIEKKQEAHILLISSNSALEPSWSPYRLSKLGIAGLTRGLAQVLTKKGIYVNAIGPGPSATSMQHGFKQDDIYYTNPISRLTSTEEIAQVAKMLVMGPGDTILGDTIYMTAGRGITYLE